MTWSVPNQEVALSAYWLRGAELLHQQCWCWGQDVRRPEGNLLLEYGFQRTSPPRGVSGSSRYTLVRGSCGVRVNLWGFGVGYASQDCGAIYINRYCFVPRWVPEPAVFDSVWQAERLTGFRRPATRRQIRRSRRLLRLAIRWIAGYEHWVAESFGPGYRRGTLQEWNRTSIAPERMALEWELLARHVEEPPP